MKRRTILSAGATIWSIFGIQLLRAENPISVCELLDNLDKYRGTMVTVKGEFHTGFEVAALYPIDCKSKSNDKQPSVRDAVYLTQPDGVPDTPPGFEMDKSAMDLFRAEYKKFKVGHSEKDPIPMIVYGKLEAAAGRRYGHLNAHIAQIVIKSMKMVVAEQVRR